MAKLFRDPKARTFHYQLLIEASETSIESFETNKEFLELFLKELSMNNLSLCQDSTKAKLLKLREDIMNLYKKYDHTIPLEALEFEDFISFHD